MRGKAQPEGQKGQNFRKISKIFVFNFCAQINLTIKKSHNTALSTKRNTKIQFDFEIIVTVIGKNLEKHLIE